MKFTATQELTKYRQKLRRERKACELEIRVCAGPGCLARGSHKIATALRQELDSNGIEVGTKLILKETGCHGLCQAAPLVTFEPRGLLYQHVRVKDVPDIVSHTVRNGDIIEKLLPRLPGTKTRVEHYKDLPFYGRQMRIALKNLGQLDPESLDDFIAGGGYVALVKALAAMTPDDVVTAVEKSGLRGRGGGGFPTGRKWRSCMKAEGYERFLICNGDEGDPGAFMDRAIMEGDPFGVLEGMTIGAFALGVKQGYIYVRKEYPLAVERLQKAIDISREVGLLGENILGTGLSFDIQISRGGGAFVCGESSALMRSIEGKVGEPRAKYIHSVEKGLYDQPTCLNNVETWTCIAPIIENGTDWFAGIGAPKNTGTKAFSIVGKVKNTGLIEVPLGTTIRQAVFDIGGGIIDDRPFKAIQTGGPSGGCLPESALDFSVDFDTLTKAGSMMGSGGLIVMDDRTCMVDVAKYFIHFLLEESCGKCVPCREGLRQLHQMLEKVTRGEGSIEILPEIERLCTVMEQGSLCALGRSAPNPVLSTLRYFREEYVIHVEEQRCPAGVCKDLITYSVIAENCNGCEVCKRPCPVEAITGEKNKLHKIDTELCTRCGICLAVCKFDAILVE